MSLKRIFQFLKRYLFKHPIYVCVYAVAYFLKGFTSGVCFYSAEELKECVRNGKSIIRIGDGEINILLDLKNHYHAFSSDLKRMIMEIVSTYSTASPYVLSVPRFVNVPSDELKKMGKFHVWLPLKVLFFLLFPKRVQYMDAHNFYYDQYFEEHIAPLLTQKKIVFITNEQTIKKQRQNARFPWPHFFSVTVPEHELLASYDEIIKKIDACLEPLVPSEVIILFAAGPVGKYLLFLYAQKGFQGIDIGKAGEVMFTGESIAHLV